MVAKGMEKNELLQKTIKNDPIVLVDVGARGGIDSKWEEIKNIMRIIAFEPDETECSRLQKSNKDNSIIYFPYALGEDIFGHKPMHICNQQGCSSFLEPNNAYIKQFYYGSAMEVVGHTEINVISLDSICEKENIRVDCMKIDVQGWELNVLRGSRNTLQGVKLIELEVEFNPQYINQPLFADVDKYLREEGFSLIGLKRAYWRRRVQEKDRLTPYGGTLMHGDALYYNEHLLRDKATERDIIALCVLLSFYKQDDFTTQLLMTPHKSLEKISEDSRQDLLHCLLTRRPFGSDMVSRMLSKIPHRTLRRIAGHLRPSSAEDWHDPEYF